MKTAVLVAFFSAGVLYPATLAAAAKDPSKALTSGTVVDAAGRAVADAEVRGIFSDSRPVRTDAAGRFEWTAMTSLVASDASGAHMGLWDYHEQHLSSRARKAEAHIVLRPSVSVKVTVLDVKSAPVPEAVVVANYRASPIAMARTNASGVAILRMPASENIWHIWGVKPGLGFAIMQNFVGSPWPAADPAPPEVSLILEPASPVQVTAVGSDGKPVPGVELAPDSVRTTAESWYLYGLERAAAFAGLAQRTDEEGRVTFDWLPASMNSVSVSVLSSDVRPQGYISWTAPKFPALPEQAGLQLKTHLLRTQSLSGKVLLPDGNPAAGILVRAFGSGHGMSCSHSAHTRADGSFTMRVDSEKSYMVGVDDDNWAARSARGVVIKEGHDCQDLVIQLVKGTLVHGLLNHTVTGKLMPFADIRVIERGPKIDPTKMLGFEKLSSTEEVLYRWVSTDAQGRYQLRLGPGDYRLEPFGSPFDSPKLHVTHQAELPRNLRGEPATP